LFLFSCVLLSLIPTDRVMIGLRLFVKGFRRTSRWDGLVLRYASRHVGRSVQLRAPPCLANLMRWYEMLVMGKVGVE